MKKLLIVMVALMLSISLCACGRRNDPVNTEPNSIMPSTDMHILPSMDPTLDTNIPDPNVDSQMPLYTEGSEATENTNANTNRGN